MGGFSIWHWILVVGAVVIPAFAAYWLARRKGRNENGWGTLVFFLPFALPIITLMSRKAAADRTASPWFVVPLAVAANVIVAIEALTLLSGLQNNGGLGLPTCGSATARDTAIAAVKSSPMGKVLGLEIIDFNGATEVTSNPTERRCSAKVLLNNGTERKANYRIFTRSGSEDWFVEVVLEDQPP